MSQTDASDAERTARLPSAERPRRPDPRPTVWAEIDLAALEPNVRTLRALAPDVGAHGRRQGRRLRPRSASRRTGRGARRRHLARRGPVRRGVRAARRRHHDPAAHLAQRAGRRLRRRRRARHRPVRLGAVGARRDRRGRARARAAPPASTSRSTPAWAAAAPIGADWPALVRTRAASRQRAPSHVVGIWTHFAHADAPEHPTVLAQQERFFEAVAEAEQAGLRPEVRHLANSAATLVHPSAHADLVRPGIAMYGLTPGAAGRRRLRPAPGHDAAGPARPRQGAAGRSGHQLRPRLRRPTVDTVVGLVPAGYADGIPRNATNVGPLLVEGRRTTIAGRVCMDQFVVDLGPELAGRGPATSSPSSAARPASPRRRTGPTRPTPSATRSSRGSARGCPGSTSAARQGRRMSPRRNPVIGIAAATARRRGRRRRRHRRRPRGQAPRRDGGARDARSCSTSRPTRSTSSSPTTASPSTSRSTCRARGGRGRGRRHHPRTAAPTSCPTVVLTHGYCLSLRCWVYQRRALKEAGYRVVSWDQRGHGRSGRGDTDSYTIDRLGQDLHTVITELVPDGRPRPRRPLDGRHDDARARRAVAALRRRPGRRAPPSSPRAPAASCSPTAGASRRSAASCSSASDPAVLGPLSHRPELFSRFRRVARDLEHFIVEQNSFASPVPRSVVRYTGRHPAQHAARRRQRLPPDLRRLRQAARAARVPPRRGARLQRPRRHPHPAVAQRAHRRGHPRRRAHRRQRRRARHHARAPGPAQRPPRPARRPVGAGPGRADRGRRRSRACAASSPTSRRTAASAASSEEAAELARGSAVAKRPRTEGGVSGVERDVRLGHDRRHAGLRPRAWARCCAAATCSSSPATSAQARRR